MISYKKSYLLTYLYTILQANYRKLLLKKKIKIYDKKQEGKKPKEFDIKKAIKFVAEAWDNVTPITINNCWKKTGILPSSDNVAVEVEDVTNLESDIENLINKFSFSSPLTAKEYI